MDEVCKNDGKEEDVINLEQEMGCQIYPQDPWHTHTDMLAHYAQRFHIQCVMFLELTWHAEGAQLLTCLWIIIHAVYRQYQGISAAAF